MTTEHPTPPPESPLEDASEGGPDDGSEGREPPSKSEGMRRPTPVRKVMETVQSKETVQPKEPARPTPPPLGDDSEAETEPLRLIDVDGETWVVRMEGAGRSGSGKDAGAPLLLLTFARVTEGPAASDPAAPEREALAVAASLDDLPYDALVELFSRSRRHRTKEQ